MLLLGYALTSGSPELKRSCAGSSSSPSAANQLGCSSDLVMCDNLLWENRKFILCVKMALIVNIIEILIRASVSAQIKLLWEKREKVYKEFSYREKHARRN